METGCDCSGIVPSNAKFCPICGNIIPKDCISCSHSIREKESNACPACGCLTKKGTREGIIASGACTCSRIYHRKKDNYCFKCASELSKPPSCFSCGNEISEDWNRCIECGSDLKAHRVAEAEAARLAREAEAARIAHDQESARLVREAEATRIEAEEEKKRVVRLEAQKEKEREQLAFRIDNELSSLIESYTLPPGSLNGLDVDILKFCFETNRGDRIITGLITTLKVFMENGQVASPPYLDGDGIDDETSIFRSLRSSLSRCHELNRTGKVNFTYHAEQSHFSECLVGKSEQYKSFAFTYFPELMVEDGIREEWIRWFMGHLFPYVSGGDLLGYPDCGKCGNAEDVTYHDGDLDTYWCGACDHEINSGGEPQCEYSDTLCDTCDVCIKCDDISGVDEEGWCHDCECSAWDSEDDEDDPLTINELLDKIRQKKLDLWDSDEVRLSMLSESLKFSNFTLSQLIEHDDEFFNQLKDRFVKEEFYVGDISKDMTPFVYNSLPDDDDDYDLAEELQDLDDNGDPWGECIFDILVSFFLEEPEDSEAKMRFAEIMADDCVVRSEFIDLVFKSEWGGNLTKEQQDLLRYGEYGNL